MALLKFVLGLVILGCIIVIVSEVRKRNGAETRADKVAADLRAELAAVEDELVRTDVESEVVDAREELKARREVLNQRIADLEAKPKTRKQREKASK